MTADPSAFRAAPTYLATKSGMQSMIDVNDSRNKSLRFVDVKRAVAAIMEMILKLHKLKTEK